MNTKWRPGQKTIVMMTATAAVIAAIGFHFLPANSRSDLRQLLRQRGLNSSFSSFGIKHLKTLVIKGKGVERLEATSGPFDIRAMVIASADEANWDSYSKQRLFEINNSYGRGILPYPGLVSHRVRCPAAYVPKVKPASGPGWSGFWTETLANPRFQIGVCDPDERHFVVAILMLYCPREQKIFDISYFVPPGQGARLKQLRDVTCVSGG